MISGLKPALCTQFRLLGELMNSRKRIEELEREVAHWLRRHHLERRQSLEAQCAGHSLEKLVAAFWDIKTWSEAESDWPLALNRIRTLIAKAEAELDSSISRIGAEEDLSSDVDLSLRIEILKTFLQRLKAVEEQIAAKVRHRDNRVEQKSNRETDGARQTSNGAADNSEESEVKPAPPLTQTKLQLAADQLPASWLNSKW